MAGGMMSSIGNLDTSIACMEGLLDHFEELYGDFSRDLDSVESTNDPDSKVRKSGHVPSVFILTITDPPLYLIV